MKDSNLCTRLRCEIGEYCDFFFFCIDKKPYCLFALHSHYIFFKMLVYNYFLISIFFSIIHMLVAKKNLKVKSMTSKHNDDLGQMKDSNLYTRSI